MNFFFKKGDLVFYDLAGDSIELNTPTDLLEEMGMGIVLEYWTSLGGSSVYRIIDRLGNLKNINVSYLKSCK